MKDDMKDILIEIDGMAERELERANKLHPMFASDHEGYAVLSEEFEEAENEVWRASQYKGQLWDKIKEDRSADAAVTVTDIRRHLVFGVAEMIQAIAMCDKFVQSSEERTNEQHN